MGGRVLRRCGEDLEVAERGFTFIETLVAMSIGIVVLLANLYLFNVAQQKLVLARSLTQATNLATSRIADFRAMTIAEITATAPTVQSGSNPLGVRSGSDVQVVDGVQYTRTWIVSSIDLENANPPVADLVGDVLKIRLVVGWTLRNKSHQVTMTTFATGRSA